MWVVSAEMQLPDILQKPPKTGIRGMAHGSISIQEGQPCSRFLRACVLSRSRRTAEVKSARPLVLFCINSEWCSLYASCLHGRCSGRPLLWHSLREAHERPHPRRLPQRRDAILRGAERVDRPQ
jgi:hypothetical protein